MTTTTEGFAATLRAATAGGHSSAEGGQFLGALQPGTFTVADFAALTSSHLVIYRALEAATDRQRDDDAFTPFAVPGLARSERLAADLTALSALTPVPAGVPAAHSYADRLAEVADRPDRLIAHHYTRYLGDMSGGQMIRHRLLELHPELATATSFYDFPEIGPLGAFKRHYRTLLDDLDPALHAGVIDEVQLAYDLNVQVFVELDQLRTT